MKQKAIIVDIDGTLTDNSHRAHFLEQQPKDWDSYHAATKDDKVNEWCAVLVYAIKSDEECVPLFVTGRNESFREITRALLENEGLDWNRVEECSSKLFMRAEGDFRPDYVIKKEIYEREIKDKYDVLFCIDDRKQVVDMWRAEGLVCLQCADGNY